MVSRRLFTHLWWSNQHCVWIHLHRAPAFGHSCLGLSFKDIWTIDSPKSPKRTWFLRVLTRVSSWAVSTQVQGDHRVTLYSSSSAARRQQAPSNSYLCWCNSFWFISPSEKGGFQPPATTHHVLCQTASPLEGRRQFFVSFNKSARMRSCAPIILCKCLCLSTLATPLHHW